MALLLTLEEAQHNKALFQSPPRSGTALQPAPSESAASIVPSISVEGTAATLAVGNSTVKSGFPPPPNATIFSDPSYHEHVISTFFTTAMTAVNYTPNSPTETPEQQAASFSRLLAELIRYGAYMPLEHSSSFTYDHSSSDCGPLLNSIEGFIEGVESVMGASNAKEVAGAITSMITNAIQALGSSSSEVVEKTLYSVFRVNGEVVGKPYPVGSIFWSSVTMERHVNGKSTVERQRVELRSYSYMILSPVVVANAGALGSATPVSSSSFVDFVNRNLP